MTITTGVDLFTQFTFTPAQQYDYSDDYDHHDSVLVLVRLLLLLLLQLVLTVSQQQYENHTAAVAEVAAFADVLTRWCVEGLQTVFDGICFCYLGPVSAAKETVTLKRILNQGVSHAATSLGETEILIRSWEPLERKIQGSDMKASRS